jgi:hypothetical protein
MGALMALALCIKPQVLLMAPLVLLVRRDWSAITGGVIAALAMILLALGLYGPQIWLEWIYALPGFSHVIDQRQLYWALITPYGFARWMGLPATPFWIGGAVLALLAVLRSARNWEDLATPIAVTSILAVPYAVPHDLVAALPWCVRVLLDRDRDWRQAPAALIFSACLVPIAIAALAIFWLKHDHRREADSQSMSPDEVCC